MNNLILIVITLIVLVEFSVRLRFILIRIKGKGGLSLHNHTLKFFLVFCQKIRRILVYGISIFLSVTSHALLTQEIYLGPLITYWP